MSGCYYKVNREAGTTLYLAPLTNRSIAVCDQNLSATSGHFLYEVSDTDPDDVRVLAHVVEEDAIFELSRMLNLEGL